MIHGPGANRRERAVDLGAEDRYNDLRFKPLRQPPSYRRHHRAALHRVESACGGFSPCKGARQRPFRRTARIHLDADGSISASLFPTRKAFWGPDEKKREQTREHADLMAR